RIRRDTGKVEFDDEFMFLLPGVHRHRCRPRGRPQDLLCEPVELTEGVGAHQHGLLTPSQIVCFCCPYQPITCIGWYRFFIALGRGLVKGLHGKFFGRTDRMTRPSSNKGIYGIAVVAELTGTGQQNLRLYERKGLLEPERTPGGTRRYSDADVQVLHRIVALLDEGVN